MSGSSQQEDIMATATSSDTGKATRRVSVEDFVSGLRKLGVDDFTGVSGTLQYMMANPVDAESL
jgi:hypothetical protein